MNTKKNKIQNSRKLMMIFFWYIYLDLSTFSGHLVDLIFLECVFPIWLDSIEYIFLGFHLVTRTQKIYLKNDLPPLDGGRGFFSRFGNGARWFAEGIIVQNMLTYTCCCTPDLTFEQWRQTRCLAGVIELEKYFWYRRRTIYMV